MASERIYTIPLRRAFSKAPNYRRTERAINEIRDFMQHHMKCENVKIGKFLNLEMWKHGRKNPPARIQVKAIKETEKDKDKDIDVVRVELVNAEFERKFDVKAKKETKKPGVKKDALEQEKKEVLEKPTAGKEETKVQMSAEEKSKDFAKHHLMESKEVEKKMREQKMIPHDQKPTHEKKK